MSKRRSRHHRKRHRRQPVFSSDNVGPTPETLAKLKPWPFQVMLRDERISVDQFEAGVEIVEAFHLITGAVGYKPVDLERVGIGRGDFGSRAERLARLYVTWGNEFQRRHMVGPHIVVAWVEDERAIHPADVPLLCHALNLWQKTAEEIARAERQKDRGIDNEARAALYSARVVGSCA